MKQIRDLNGLQRSLLKKIQTMFAINNPVSNRPELFKQTDKNSLVPRIGAKPIYLLNFQTRSLLFRPNIIMLALDCSESILYYRQFKLTVTLFMRHYISS